MEVSSLLYMAMAVFGIGLVIFVHELGHYLAARICGVRVETFSLGMGPKLVGWRVGPTLYQIAAVPLGGFCRMAGEERRLDGRPPEPDELPAKSVGARFFIYSGGVLMNVLFGLTVFPILFHFGVRFSKPVLGEPIPGTPAWHARMEPGSEVLSVNGERVIDFGDIQSEAAIGAEETVFELRDPHTGAIHTQRVVPRFEPLVGFAMVGVRPAYETDDQGHPVLAVAPDSAAAEAGLHDGDRLLAVVGGLPGLSPADQIEALAPAPVTLRVLRADGSELEATVTPRAEEPGATPRLGISPPQVYVADVRVGPQTGRIDLRPMDRLVSLDGTPILRDHDFHRLLLAGAGEPHTLRLRRGGRELETPLPALSREEVVALVEDLYVTNDPESTRIVVQPGEAGALAGLRDGDRILEIDGVGVEDFAGVSNLIRRSVQLGAPARLSIERLDQEGAASFLTIDVKAAPPPQVAYGLGWKEAVYTFRTNDVLGAMAIGTQRSWKSLVDSWRVLQRILQGRISAKDSVGGIITIGVLSYNSAEAGLDILFYLLCIISINLAFLNVLPIPVLDGGHLFFLIVEKIKGSPVSERVLGYSQMVGVVLILSLVVYVTYNDLVRWVFPS